MAAPAAGTEATLFPPAPHGVPVAARPIPPISGKSESADDALKIANLRAMAWYLGMNLILDAPHMSIAEAALAADLPDNWLSAKDSDGHTYHWSTEFEEVVSQWEHPSDAEFRRQLLVARTDARAAKGEDPVAGMSVPGFSRPVAGEANVEDMAVYLGMDMHVDLSLLWIADAALMAEVPKGWTAHGTAQGQPFFHNAQFGITQVRRQHSSAAHPKSRVDNFINCVVVQRGSPS
jgi:hypothetical protein